MIPWTLVEAAPIPGGSGDLRLMRRGEEAAIWLGAVELMNTRRGGSEAALAALTCARLADQSRAKVLIGGLGLGFTLRAALAGLGAEARLDVAELVPAVVAWARGPLAALFAGSLEDRRVRVVEADVGVLIAAGVGAYDAILLDVDNGPAGQTRAANDGLYGPAGLAKARRALRPGGLLAVWSVEPNAAFAGRMRKAGFAIEEARVRAHAGASGGRHVIWIGRRG